MNNLIFICKNCNSISTPKLAQSGCFKCNHNLFKVSWNTGIPLTQDIVPQKDQYRRKSKPGDGKGQKLTMPGNEDMAGEAGSGLGTNRRGKDGPQGYSTDSDGQTGKDLPTEPVVMDNYPRDYNYQSSQEVHGGLIDAPGAFRDDFMSRKPQPVGPFNMSTAPTENPNKYNDIFDKVRKRKRV